MRLHILHHRDLKDVEREMTLLLAAATLLVGVTLAIYTYAALLG